MPLVCVKSEVEHGTHPTNEIIASMQISIDSREVLKPDGSVAIATDPCDLQQMLDNMREAAEARTPGDGERHDSVGQQTAVGEVHGAGQRETAAEDEDDDNNNNDKRSYGKASAYWTEDAVGDVLIFREDFGAVTVEVVEAFAVFCKKMEARIQTGFAYGEADEPDEMQWAIDEVSREVSELGWKDFMGFWRAKKMRELKDILGQEDFSWEGWNSGRVSWTAGFTDLLGEQNKSEDVTEQ